MIVIVMGVSGSGKTTVGRALAEKLGAPFLDADEFHPPSNVAKMSRGEALSDADRRPWLEAMNRVLLTYDQAGAPVVLACSALKASYRAALTRGLKTDVRLVHLRVDRATLHDRMTRRTDHFMPVGLLDSQLETLEEPADALVVDGARSVGEVVAAVVHRLTHE